MASTRSKVGHGLAKVLGIKVDYRNDTTVTRGESTYSVSTADSYVEDEPRTIDWIKDLFPTRHQWIAYGRSLFPFTHWIMRYNTQWLIGDLVAGITVGAVVVPQSMAYAKLAELPPEYGLYSSFMGVLIYWFFATSKDITIGPVAVMSTIVGNVVNKVQEEHPEVPGHIIASALAVIAGAIISFIGLIRCGWIVNFIPLTAISAFITGSAINIAVGQVPTLMGIKVKGFNTRASTYLVVINTLKYLGHTKLDAAIGLTALAMLYLIRFTLNRCAKKMPHRAKLFFFLSTLRTAFVLCLYILIAWLVNRHHREKPKFQLLRHVPRGFKHAAVPTVNTEIIGYFASELPASVIVLLIEHIAISKSFGRINNYTINPSQELVAIGVTNLLGPFLGAYPATGSFSRTAIKSKAGVRTPFAGVITAIVVLLALYALPAMFFYIPNAALAAVIIHAVLDLPTPPNVLYQFWRVSPLEVIIFLLGVFVTIFSSIENGIYSTISVSAAVLLYRVVKAHGHFVGKVKVHSVIGDHLIEDKFHDQPRPSDSAERNIFLPLDHNDGSNPSIHVESPYPGIFIYRFSEGFNYPNASHYTDYLVEYVFEHTRRTNPDSWPRPGDRPWNNPGPRRGKTEADRSHLPTLKAVILDFQAVNNVDVTSVQDLIDIRNQLDRYASPEPVQWHLANINNRWTKRALASAGFGFPTVPQQEIHRWKPIFSVAEIGGSESAAEAAEAEANRRRSHHGHDEEHGRPRSRSKGEDITQADRYQDDSHSSTSSHDNDLAKEITDSKAYARAASVKKVAVVHGLNRPFFHLDLTSALQSAIANVEHQEKLRRVEAGQTEGSDDKL
ncbi:SulP family sulfate permease [Cladophialophora yegresii CBS 114405]|uniref:SulP family sulfate permease n=1 Tax=Cladophialophora yegresii CBS 114405 TaxID=1182544 RepID=W9VQY5_9EURO|nr:SulP family sulfate permease [Cladophialophora yegresii CBS 114405]EXJ54576.1 SulP family sulfate permease [Cladophialophora yegresii CBS 114405]